MSTTNKISANRFNNTIERVFGGDFMYHAIFWIVFFLFLIVNSQPLPLVENLLKSIIDVLFYGSIVYVNIFYLFPKFMITGKIGTYLLLLFASVLLITPIKTLTFYGVQAVDSTMAVFMEKNLQKFFLSIFFMACASSIYKIINDWARQRRERVDLQRQTLRSELNFLRSQINPHFLFNTLNSLYALTLKKSDKAPEIVLRLSEMMRYMLYECNERYVPLEKEINYISNYLELEKIRHKGKCDIEFEMIGVVGRQKIAPLLFIPFIENSFKHGLNSQIIDGFVDIIMNIKDDSITMNIKNSKSEAKPKAPSKISGGVGLVNVRRRLNLLYPEQYDLNINESPNQYEVSIDINLN